MVVFKRVVHRCPSAVAIKSRIPNQAADDSRLLISVQTALVCSYLAFSRAPRQLILSCLAGDEMRYRSRPPHHGSDQLEGDVHTTCGCHPSLASARRPLRLGRNLQVILDAITVHNRTKYSGRSTQTSIAAVPRQLLIGLVCRIRGPALSHRQGLAATLQCSKYVILQNDNPSA